jgi:hypothetical protein
MNTIPRAPWDEPTTISPGYEDEFDLPYPHRPADSDLRAGKGFVIGAIIGITFIIAILALVRWLA